MSKDQVFLFVFFVAYRNIYWIRRCKKQHIRWNIYK